MRMAILAGIFGSLLSIGPLSAQVTVQSSSPTLDSQGRRSISWGTLNRTEAIAVGSLPLTLFYVGFGFDLYAYFSNGLDALYAPWPFKSDRAPALTDKEKTLRLSVAALASLGVAVLDLVLLPRAFAKRHAEGDRRLSRRQAPRTVPQWIYRVSFRWNLSRPHLPRYLQVQLRRRWAVRSLECHLAAGKANLTVAPPGNKLLYW